MLVTPACSEIHKPSDNTAPKSNDGKAIKGALLVADDVGNIIWRVSAANQ